MPYILTRLLFHVFSVFRNITTLGNCLFVCFIEIQDYQYVLQGKWAAVPNR